MHTFSFIQEPELLLGTERQWTGSGEKRRYAVVREEMIYIPLLKTIQSLFHNPDIVRMVSSNGTYTISFIDHFLLYCRLKRATNQVMELLETTVMLLYFQNIPS